LIYYSENFPSIITLYFTFHFIIVAGEYACTVSNTPENPFISSGKQSENHIVDENIFETIESSFDTEATTISSHYSKKRKQTTSCEDRTTLSNRIKSKRSRLS